jgi:hypothetical protein
VLAAAACLAKYTNVVALPVLGVATLLAWRGAASGASRRGLVLMWALALLPIAGWMIRNQLLFGDPTATALKIDRLGWGRKPVSEWLDHPLFTLGGLGTFLGDLIATFWRGELAWYRHTLVSPLADRFYLLSSALCLALAALGALRSPDAARRRQDALAALMIVTSVSLLALLSLMYEFTETSNPSASRPFFVQGRLISAAIAPFLLLYLRGIEVATSALRGRAAALAAWSCVAAVIAVVGVSEVRLSLPVFASGYNWFHLP